MAGRTKQESKDPNAGSAGGSVDALAARALTMVAERHARVSSEFDQSRAQQLHDAAARVDENNVPAVVEDFLSAGIPAEVISDVYIPHVARKMGDEWCEDTLSFARVTIGTARLQSALRTLGGDWTSFGFDADATQGESAAVIVLVVRDSFHTLGAVVLAGQLRRLGMSVKLAMGPSPVELRAIFASTDFDAALISANESEGLDSLRETVEVIRKSAAVCPPIVVGGSVLDQGVDVKAFTGADYVTKDPYEALRHCGLTNPNHTKPLAHKRRT